MDLDRLVDGLSSRRLTLLLLAVVLAQSALVAYFTLQYSGFWRLVEGVNARWNVPDPRVFITPIDPAVRATVVAVTYGRLDPVKEEDLRLCLRMLFDWVSVNIRPSRDSPYPVLPGNPFGKASFINEVWQYPNETLALGSGDCEDAATLLLSMVKFYSPRLKAACVLVEGARGGHVAVLISKNGEAAIMDPGLYYCTKDKTGFLAFTSLVAELDKWLTMVEEKVGADAHVTMLFSDTELARFKSTNEFIAYFNLNFKL